uniref:Uncharacterized protein n=1 Tax=Lepeophtheirus salmonis TaxID=72036 RepID=A0A0K2SZJ4_LEPSM
MVDIKTKKKNRLLQKRYESGTCQGEATHF